jgi:septum formation protein
MTPLAAVDLVLASTSRYRRELLTRITSRVRQIAPDVDETPLPHEAPAALATRLAAAKARAVAAKCPGAVVIGSDQVADLSATILGKPGTAEHAHAQLAACSGHEVVFHTAIHLLDTRAEPAREYAATDTTRVHFRTLGAEEIARYIERESPLDCAGSFKSEGLGVGLFERIACEDPTALIGLPLIALCRLLRQAGIATI